VLVAVFSSKGANGRVTRGIEGLFYLMGYGHHRVTKEVDMKFTRVMDRPRFQLLVLDPELIPYSVDVVIGDFIYELHFKVEPEMMLDNVELLSMDDMEDKGGEGEGKEDSQDVKNTQIDQGGQGQSGDDSSGTPKNPKSNSEVQ
jgi:hypothetical protein